MYRPSLALDMATTKRRTSLQTRGKDLRREKKRAINSNGNEEGSQTRQTIRGLNAFDVFDSWGVG